MDQRAGTGQDNVYVAPGATDPAGPVLSFSVDFDKVVQLHDV